MRTALTQRIVPLVGSLRLAPSPDVHPLPAYAVGHSQGPLVRSWAMPILVLVAHTEVLQEVYMVTHMAMRIQMRVLVLRLCGGVLLSQARQQCLSLPVCNTPRLTRGCRHLQLRIPAHQHTVAIVQHQVTPMVPIMDNNQAQSPSFSSLLLIADTDRVLGTGLTAVQVAIIVLAIAIAAMVSRTRVTMYLAQSPMVIDHCKLVSATTKVYHCQYPLPIQVAFC